MSGVKIWRQKVICGQIRSNIQPQRVEKFETKSSNKNYGVFSFLKLYYSCMLIREARFSIKTCENIIITNITIYNL